MWIFKISKFTSIHTLVLSTFSIDGSISGTLKADILPPNLTINKTQLPSTLEILKFYGKNFSHGKIENDSKFKIFETDSLPNGLKKFIVSRYPGFNQNIQVNNFFPISCTYIYLIGFMRPIPTKLKDGAVVSIFPENLKELIFFELMLNQPLLLLLL